MKDVGKIEAYGMKGRDLVILKGLLICKIFINMYNYFVWIGGKVYFIV